MMRSRIAVLALLGVVGLAGCSGSNPPQAEDPPQLASPSTNASGLTYGSALGATNRDDEPDLIEVVATNGKSGYVLKTELYAGEPSNPEEAVKTQLASEKAKVVAARSLLEKDLGLVFDDTTADFTEGASILDSLAVAWGSTPTKDLCRQEIGRFVEAVGAELGPTVQIESGICDAVVQASSTANQRTIPVYESNGVTVLGEFPVG
jgi:hypothetical protein